MATLGDARNLKKAVEEFVSPQNEAFWDGYWEIRRSLVRAFCEERKITLEEASRRIFPNHAHLGSVGDVVFSQLNTYLVQHGYGYVLKSACSFPNKIPA